MYRYPDGTYKLMPPSKVEYKGYMYPFSELTAGQKDEIGYNEAIPFEREPHATYVTEWNKGDDLVYRESILSKTVDTAAMKADLSQKIRVERDAHLTQTDWTQLVDCPLDDLDIVHWQSYRQALRDVPQQAGFPESVDWPEMPEVE